jgi:pyruvate dehydrogenase E1 component beta subunit
MPSTPYDAKGLMASSIRDNNPVIFIEHRWLMKREGIVPAESYEIPLGKGVVRQQGNACTVVGASHAIDLALAAAKQLKAEAGLEAEVIDLRTVKPLDEALILESLAKTGKLLVVDSGWSMGGVCAEIGCIAAEKGFSYLKAPVARIGLPDCPSPAGNVLENYYYPNTATIKSAIAALAKK